MIYRCEIETPIGPALARAGGGALTGFWFMGQKYFPGDAQSWEEKPDLPEFVKLRAWLARYFAGEAPALDFRLETRGTPFQEDVWRMLQQIPHGELRTYKDLAGGIAKERGLASMSAQAVGGAVGRNPISLLIPCHRVVGASGGLTGYAGGVDKKEALLRLEGALDEVI